jgi:hypothetical protein
VYVLWSSLNHFFGLEVWQGFISSCVDEVLKGEKNGLICNKKYMSLVQSCLLSVGFNWCIL